MMTNKPDLVPITKTQARPVYDLAAARLHAKVKSFGGVGGPPVLTIADAYPGLWLEASPYDGLRYVQLLGGDPAVAKGNIDLFLKHQREDGQFPAVVLDKSDPRTAHWGFKDGVWYGQLQELVPLAWIIEQTAALTKDESLLAKGYAACCRWDDWLVRHRQTRGTGVFEIFCEYDMGMDFSARATDGGIPHNCPDGEAGRCPQVPCLPLLAPDLSAVAYGARRALSRMAQSLGRHDEARLWTDKANATREAIDQHCFDPKDEFYYDIDSQSHCRKYRTCHITFLLSEDVPDDKRWETIYQQHMKNPAEFWTKFPFPSVAASDPSFDHQFSHHNSWGCWTNSPLLYRLSRWMLPRGKSDDLHYIMSQWAQACISEATPHFRQCVNPFTGEWGTAAGDHSNSLLFFVESVQQLGLL